MRLYRDAGSLGPELGALAGGVEEEEDAGGDEQGVDLVAGLGAAPHSLQRPPGDQAVGIVTSCYPPGPHLMCRWAYMLASAQVSSASLHITSEI